MKDVSARGVSVRFGALQALDAVDMTLRAGEPTMLVGPNGAGKSTLMRVLLGLVRPDAGELRIDGIAQTIDNDWKRRIGYLPEAVAFSDNLSGQQVLRFFAQARGIERAHVDEVLRRVGLYDARRRAVRGYSRGMRQRLGLGTAILASPDLLILDEPTGGLDQEGLAVLWSVLQEWRDAGKMVLIATHDLALVERRVDTVCILKGGKVVASGTSQELREAAQIRHRVHFDVDERDDRRVVHFCKALGQWGHAEVTREDGRVTVEVTADAMLELMTIQTSFAGVIRSIRVEEPTLDLVYDRILGAAS